MRDWSTAAEQLREEGVAVLRHAFPVDVLIRLKRVAEVCFEAIARGQLDAGKYRFTPFSHSVLIEALHEFGADDLMVPLRISGIDKLAADVMGGEVECRLAESWARKRFAPSNAPRRFRPNSWHQDGGLGVRYDADAGAVGPMTRLLTCWIPLRDCGGQCPGLEFVRGKLDGLLHYKDLDDAGLRQRFATELFWVPEVKLGDGLLFLNGSLHRTHVRPEMSADRLSLEYRFFPLAG
jgi:hypothetical protein